jgi:RNA polymerase sigma-70 factor (sigma-E family)
VSQAIDVQPDDEPVRLAPTRAARVQADISDVYALHWLSLVRLAVLFVDDIANAEDVVQDAFTSLYRRPTPLRDPDAALGYLRASVVNGCRSMLRRRRTRRAYQGPDGPLTSPAADSELLMNEDNRRVLEAVRSLPRRQREVVLLRYWSDFSEANIARTLGVSVGSVKSAASRGLDRLEKALGESR